MPAELSPNNLSVILAKLCFHSFIVSVSSGDISSIIPLFTCDIKLKASILFGSFTSPITLLIVALYGKVALLKLSNSLITSMTTSPEILLFFAQVLKASGVVYKLNSGIFTLGYFSFNFSV